MPRLSRALRFALLTVLTVLLVGLVFVGTSIGYATFVDHRRLIIDSPNGIAEGMYVSIGGIDQWTALKIDSETAEVMWTYAQTLDPYPRKASPRHCRLRRARFLAG
jgi:hypothetical protein